MFLFSNLTQILNLPAIYIIPFRFMNYKEESISLDKNTLKLLYASFLTTPPPQTSFSPRTLLLFCPSCGIAVYVTIIMHVL